MFVSVEGKEADFTTSVFHCTSFGQKATEKAFLNFFSVLFDLSPEDTDLAGSAAVGRDHWFSTNFSMFLTVFSDLELPVQRSSKSCKEHESEGGALLCLKCRQGLSPALSLWGQFVGLFLLFSCIILAGR